MLQCSRITNKTSWWPLRQELFSISNHFSSSHESKVCNLLDEGCEGFLAWLERKAGVRISSKLYIGKSPYGRSLFASRSIKAGESLLKVPYNVQLSPDNLFPEVIALLGNDVGHDSKVAIVVLAEQKIGLESEWAPYIGCLPHPGEMHSTIFWSQSELEMIRQSLVYQKTVNLKAQLERDFLTIEPVLERSAEIFGGITLEDFMHAYALVKSRAWGSAKGVSLIPFADFLNHDGVSEAIVLNDDDKQVSEVSADRNYAPHEEVLIRYGKFSNATLLLDFGFTLPYNIHDQVQIQIPVPSHDILRETKLEILNRHLMPTTKTANGFKFSRDFFTIKEVRSATGSGKGLPQSLRAFSRVLCCTSPEELSGFVLEASQNDGRLARRPLKDSSREREAHETLLSHFHTLIEDYNASIESLRNVTSSSMSKKFGLRRQMARDLLNGELRVLRSAHAWLKNYCANLSQSLAA